MNDSADPKERAMELFDRAYEYQIAGELEEAIRLYKRSIEIHPTAEAHTFLGWTYSFQGRIHDAIEECHKAIEVDPTFGNPYNDIGAYLIQLDRHDEAIPWLKKAIEAPRYDARAYPYVNLGRVYEHKGQWEKAIEYYEKAMEEDPEHTAAQHRIVHLRAKMNGDVHKELEL